MAKAKRKRNKAKGRRFRVLMSFELRKPDKKLLPESKEGIFVKGEIAQEKWFFAGMLWRLLDKGYVKDLPAPKEKKKNKVKAAH